MNDKALLEITIAEYDRNAAIHAKRMGNTVRITSPLLAAAALLPQGSKILDIGCGTGSAIPSFSNIGARYTGIDAAAALLAIAKQKHPGFDLRLLRAEDCGSAFPIAHLDAFFGLSFMYHLSPEFIGRTLLSLSRITKRGGIGYFDIFLGDRNAAVTQDVSLILPEFPKGSFGTCYVTSTDTLQGICASTQFELVMIEQMPNKLEYGVVVRRR